LPYWKEHSENIFCRSCRIEKLQQFGRRTELPAFCRFCRTRLAVFAAPKAGGMDSDYSAPPPVDPFAYQAWLDEILPLPEGARLRTVSVPALKRAEARRAKERGEPNRIMELTERRRGIRRRHALLLPEPEEDPHPRPRRRVT
jgi:hypothetical protein